MDQSPSYQELLKRLRELEQESLKRQQAEQFADAVLNSLSAHIAILDQEGVIIETNRAWKEFAQANQIRMRPDTLGVNYIKLCESAKGDSAERSREVAEGISAVIAGKMDEFIIDYPCHSPEEKRWFYMRVTRLSETGPLRVVVSHENITTLKCAEEALKKRELDLKHQAQSLQEANTALKVLLKRREEDKRELEEKVLSNVRNFIIPYINKLGRTRLDSSQKVYLEIIESHLNDVISPFLHQLSSRYLDFTPQEIQVATLARDGKMTKEIAEILNISTNAVHFHRKNIRKKLGLKSKRTNLRSYLLSLS
jgi:DNA-binding CsgD family transcriptional regulator